MNRLLSPSILSADFVNLQRDIELINNSEADWIHIDVMDGTFVPNITIGQPVVKAIKKVARKPLDVHLMIVHPEKYIDDYKECGADWLTVHYEACTHLHRTLEYIKSKGMKAGVSLNPHTPVSALEDIVNVADLILVMSVNPGFGGQKFIPNSFEKIKRLKDLLVKHNSSALIEVDGGVDLNNANLLYETGVDVLVSGNAIFSSPDPLKTIHLIKQHR